MNYFVTFTVIGRSAFPVDMLRYDSCFPNSEEDAAKIAHTLSGDYSVVRDGPQEIKLAKYTATKPRDIDDAITPNRWRSFGWTTMSGCDVISLAPVRRS